MGNRPDDAGGRPAGAARPTSSANSASPGRTQAEPGRAQAIELARHTEPTAGDVYSYPQTSIRIH